MSVNERAIELWGLLSIELPQKNIHSEKMVVGFEDGREAQTLEKNELDKFRFSTYIQILASLLDMKLQDGIIENRLVGMCVNVEDFTEHEWGFEVTLNAPYKRDIRKPVVLNGISKVDFFEALKFDVNGITTVSIYLDNNK